MAYEDSGKMRSALAAGGHFSHFGSDFRFDFDSDFLSVN